MSPVEEHAVHHLVRHDANTPYGCSNLPSMKAGYWLQVREYKDDGTYVMRDKYIKHAMSDKCRNYYLWYSDVKCRQCMRPKDREYAQRMERLK